MCQREHWTLKGSRLWDPTSVEYYKWYQSGAWSGVPTRILTLKGVDCEILQRLEITNGIRVEHGVVCEQGRWTSKESGL